MIYPHRKAIIRQHGRESGELSELPDGRWRFTYFADYQGAPISLTLPVREEPYDFDQFPPVFEGLLPEGPQLEALLRLHKIDRHDAFRQLVTVGSDMIGSLTIVDASDSPSLTEEQ